MLKQIFTSSEQSTYKIAILIKEQAIKEDALKKFYIDPLIQSGFQNFKISDFIAYGLPYQGKTAPVKLQREFLKEALAECKTLRVSTLIVCDSSYFKTIAGKRKSEPSIGYMLSCVIQDYQYMDVIVAPNYQATFYNPSILTKITTALETLIAYTNGTYDIPGKGVIHSEYYPSTTDLIKDTLQKLSKYPALTCDVETNGLNLASIASISFAWDKHNGIAFPIYNSNSTVFKYLRNFFIEYKGTLIFHSATFDIKQIIWNFWMERDIGNYEKMLEGLEIMYRNIHDSLIIAHLALNSTERIKLNLKELGAPHAGDYALDDIKNINQIPMAELLRYNLIDAITTWYVYDKYYPKMIADQQEDIYKTILIPSLKVITQAELTGMPLDMNTASEAYNQLLNAIRCKNLYIWNQPIIKEWEWKNKLANFIAGNQKLKTKHKSIDAYHEKFNPNSGDHIRELLHEILDLDIISTTDTGLASTGNKVLKEHVKILTKKFNIIEQELL